jgi:hypothetical protein
LISLMGDKNLYSILGGGEVFFQREGYPLVDAMILSAHGDTVIIHLLCS